MAVRAPKELEAGISASAETPTQTQKSLGLEITELEDEVIVRDSIEKFGVTD